jgi:drug/metabolite transporter (DMT)-like permease
VFWRSLFAAMALLALVLVQHGRNLPVVFARMGWPGIIVATCFATASISFILALNMTTVANVVFIFSSAPLLAALLGRFMLGEAVGTAGWLALAACAAGVGLMVSDSIARGSVYGDLLALLIALAQAVAIVTVRRHKDVPMTPAMALAMLACTAIALTLAAPLAVSARDLALLALFGAGQLGVGLALFSLGAPLLPALQVALLGLLEPILAPVWVWMAFGEAPAASALWGGLIVLVSLVLHTISSFAKRASRIGREA